MTANVRKQDGWAAIATGASMLLIWNLQPVHPCCCIENCMEFATGASMLLLLVIPQT